MTQPPNAAKVSIAADREIHVERTFDAPRDRVWRAMTDPKLLAQWWGRGNPLTVETYEFRRGGHWRFVEHTAQGDFGFEGRFREIEPPEHLELTFDFDGAPGHVVVNSITLHELDGSRTRLTSRSLFYSNADRDGMMQEGMERGMNESYTALDRVLAAMG